MGKKKLVTGSRIVYQGCILGMTLSITSFDAYLKLQRSYRSAVHQHVSRRVAAAGLRLSSNLRHR